jgi:cyanophycin synthetase
VEWHRVWILRGANVWARRPVLEFELDTSGAGTDLAHALQRATLELQRQAGSDVSFGLVRQTSQPGVFRVVVEYEEEELGLACLEAARRQCLAGLRGEPFDREAELATLRDLAYDVRLGPSTGAIVRAARARGIPVRRLNRASLVQLGQGIRQRRICTAETDRTSAIAETVAQDKQLTRALLQAVGVPVPQGRPVSDAEDAWKEAEELGPPVVVKPQFGNHGRGVAVNLTTREQVVRAYAEAREHGEGVVVERYVPGVDFRLLVVGDRLVAAALREPAQVVGDGRSSVAELVAEVNRDPRRSDGHATVLSVIKLDSIALAVLAEQGHSPESVPATGARVLIRRNANLSTGGTATDVTDRVHPEVAARAVEAARAVGLDIAGVDVVAVDVDRPLEEQRGAVVEVNAGPGLRMHLEPTAGRPRPVGEAVVDMLFPKGQNGRIPVAAVTGVNGKTTTTRLLAHLLHKPGHVLGMACTDGLYVGGRRVSSRDCSGPQSARALLLHPRVSTAILETARGGILREGLGFDCCDVAVVTNIGGGDHLDLRGVETLDDLARVKRTVVEAVDPAGAAVLNAADPLVVAMAGHCPGRVIYFARDPDNPVVVAHRRAGGQAVLARDALIVLAEGAREEPLAALADVPLTHGGRVGFQVENVLAAAAAAWALRVPRPVLRDALGSFTGGPGQVPGRFNVLRDGDATVIVDYAHNPSALAALVEALGQFPHERRTLVFSACNRRDADVVEMGALAGDGFDRVILYRDRGNNDRSDGELNDLLRRGLAGGRRLRETAEVDGERAAIDAALGAVRPGDLVVVGVEAIEESLAFTQAYLAESGLVAAPR